MSYNRLYDNLSTNSNQLDDTPRRQSRVRCYTCKVNHRGRDGICKNFANNTCPYGYHDDKQLFNDLLMEQQEQM